MIRRNLSNTLKSKKPRISIKKRQSIEERLDEKEKKLKKQTSDYLPYIKLAYRKNMERLKKSLNTPLFGTYLRIEKLLNRSEIRLREKLPDDPHWKLPRENCPINSPNPCSSCTGYYKAGKERHWNSLNSMCSSKDEGFCECPYSDKNILKTIDKGIKVLR